ncbi:MAG: ppGpp synthetase/RelA/SpoT-type nucleotidyltransferase [Maritalea sp.]
MDRKLSWPTPLNSKNRIRTAGKRIAKAQRENGDLFWHFNVSRAEYEVAENWRNSHGAVLNTAQAWLRRLEKDQRPVVGQRLKRFNTIVDKLSTGRSRDLSTMHDIAGVRLIFRNEQELWQFRGKMDASRAKHKRTHDLARFDYIANPKNTGYRGVHDVFERQVGAADKSSAWNGMKFEVQLRTTVQHAWATAVEVYDSVQQARFKFEDSKNDAYRQFLLISEMFARVHEGKNSCLPNLADKELTQQCAALEQKTGMIAMFRSLSIAQTYDALKQNSILQRRKDGTLYVWPFRNLSRAIQAISDIEARDETANAVLVAAKTPLHIREAFRNYFDDTSDFLNLYDDAMNQIHSFSNDDYTMADI